MTLEKAVFAILMVAALAFAEITWEEARIDRARLEVAIASQQQIIDASENRERSRDAALKSTLAQIAATKKTVETPTQILSALQQSLDLPEPIALGTKIENKLEKGITKSKNSDHLPSKSTAGIPSAEPRRDVKDLEQPQSSLLPTTADDSSQVTPSSSEHSGSSISNLKYELRDFFARKSQSPAKSTLSSSDYLSPVGYVLNLHSNSTEIASIPTADLKPLFDNLENCYSSEAQLATEQADLADERNRSASLTKERDAAITSAKGGNLWHRVKQNSKWLAVGVALTVLISRTH